MHHFEGHSSFFGSGAAFGHISKMALARRVGLNAACEEWIDGCSC
jgi:hypothetical protein